MVTPGMRSRGIGTALIAAAERLALARSIREIGLGVADDNPRARQPCTCASVLPRSAATTTTATVARETVDERCRFLVKHLLR